MSAQYIVQSAAGLFLTMGGGWSTEYPNARLFQNLQSARRAIDAIRAPMPPVEIYTTEDYAMGRQPTVLA